MKKLFATFLVVGAFATASNGQILLSSGLTYSQNFDSLASSAVTTVPWTDNSTLLGWYASKGLPTPTVAIPSYRVSGGEANNGSVWSFGTNGVNSITDRALGSVASGTPGTNAWGVRFQNDSGSAVNNILITYTAEQWRNGGNTAAQQMYFSYEVSSTAFTSPISATHGDTAYTAFAPLTYTTQTVGATATALDGNDPANRTVFSGILLTGVTLNPGDELMLRWDDINDTGNDHGAGVDDFSISFSQVPEPSTAVLGGLGVLAAVIWRRRK